LFTPLGALLLYLIKQIEEEINNTSSAINTTKKLDKESKMALTLAHPAETTEYATFLSPR
jgi:hypothetical protein